MFKRALVLGLLVLSSTSSFAQCRNISPAQYGIPSYGVQSGAYYDARTGGRYVNPNAGYYGNPVSNNVRVYQDQLNQAYQVGAYNAYNNAAGFNNGYNNVYNNGYTNQFGQVTITPQFTSNQPGYVGVNPWNGYAGQSYNGYNYGQFNNNAYRGRNCRPQHNAFNQRFWVNR